MKRLYLLTGATGHLGSWILRLLKDDKQAIRILVLPSEKNIVPDGVDVVYGDITDKDSMKPFFNTAGFDETVLIHCAAIVSIVSDNPLIHKVNVEGTRNVLDMALENRINRVIYVSSVHAIEEKPNRELITETKDFNPDRVTGQYAKSKAEAARLALTYCDKGLDLSIVHPSGIIGPGDYRSTNNSINTLKAMYTGKIFVAMSGGYDFVDVRDVASGIISCVDSGRNGETYLLSGEYISVKQMLEAVNEYKNRKFPIISVPDFIVGMVAPVSQWLSLHFGNGKPLLTPYSLYTLRSNSNFSNEKAKKELGFNPRSIKESIVDTLEDQ